MPTEIPPHLFAQTEPRIEISIDCPHCDGDHTIEAPELLLSLDLAHEDCGGKLDGLVLAYSNVEARSLEDEPQLKPDRSDIVQI